MEELHIYDHEETSVCFFRTTVKDPYKKCLLQITEKCNLKCKHCFLSANNQGSQMSYEDIVNLVIPYLKNNNVVKVTLTGGEPLVHENIYEIIKILVDNAISVTVCSNGSLLDMELLNKLQKFSNVKFNISLDGFSNETHGAFRNSLCSNLFDKVKENIILLRDKKLLKGILVTPNKISSIDEYVEICVFAKSIGAKYVLMNPLSHYGRGAVSKNLAMKQSELKELKKRTIDIIDKSFDIIYIRFPNEGKQLSKCKNGKVLYVFTNGNIAICPYMVFGAYNSISKYKPDDFCIGNIFNNPEDLDKLLSLYQLPQNSGITTECIKKCSRGCIAAKISNGLNIGDCDMELCPMKTKN